MIGRTTSTATITMINNNVDHNPTLQKPGATQTDKGPNGLLTIYPKDLPIHPFHWPACTTLKGGDKEAYKAQVSSVCSCSGIEPRTTGGPTFVGLCERNLHSLRLAETDFDRLPRQPKKSQRPHLTSSSRLCLAMAIPHTLNRRISLTRRSNWRWGSRRNGL